MKALQFLGLSLCLLSCENALVPNESESFCGDGFLNLGEVCDDANPNPGDGCSPACFLERCGNAILDPGEECDDGNLGGGDGCSAACLKEICGDRVIEGAEECDDGNNINNDGCSATCAITICGNGVTEEGEQCDDQNTFLNDGCREDCTAETCGDGILDPEEQCDDGGHLSGDGCRSDCSIEQCGDGFVSFSMGEECDDQNFVSGDGCQAECNLAPACLYRGSGLCYQEQQVSVGESIGDALWLDVDGDEDLDIAAVQEINYTSKFLVILQNNNGQFTTTASLALAERQFRLTKANLNADPLPDLIVTGPTGFGGEEDIQVFFNVGGQFQEAQNLPKTIEDQIATGDFDENGFTDIAYSKRFLTNIGPQIGILYNNGNGSFTDSVAFDNAYTPASGDVNNDGHIDLITFGIVPSGEAGFSVLLNDGTGLFTSLQQLPAGDQPEESALVDLNNDSFLDVIVYNIFSYDIMIYLNDQTGHFVKTGNFLIGVREFLNNRFVVDHFNDDNLLDIATMSSFEGVAKVLMNDGNGQFHAEKTTAASLTNSISAADFNNDGRPDLLTNGGLSAQAKIRLFTSAPCDAVCGVSSCGNGIVEGLEECDGTTPEGDLCRTDCTIEACGDSVLDSKEQCDFDFRDPSSELGCDPDCSYAEGVLHYRTPKRFEVGYSPRDLVTGDFNGDSWPDLVTTNHAHDRESSLSILLNDQNGGFLPSSKQTLNFRPTGLTIGDLNSDGHPDLVVLTDECANLCQDPIMILLGDGLGSFGQELDIPIGNSPQDAVITDLNHDGLLDISVAHWETTIIEGTIQNLISQGNLNFSLEAAITVPLLPRSITAADLDQNGLEDLIVGGFQGLVAVYNQGDGAFFVSPVIETRTNRDSSLLPADFDSDGDIDIAFTADEPYDPNATTISMNRVGVAWNNGEGQLAVKATIPINNLTFGVGLAAGDVDQDGDLELISGTTHILTNQGEQRFTHQAQTLYLVNGGGIVAGDFNLNGKVDFAIANNGFYGIEVFYQ